MELTIIRRVYSCHDQNNWYSNWGCLAALLSCQALLRSSRFSPVFLSCSCFTQVCPVTGLYRLFFVANTWIRYELPVVFDVISVILK